MVASSSRSSRHASSTSSSTPTSTTSPWQELLEDTCREWNLVPPTYQIVSDRRGSRTAWSSHVLVHSRTIEARFWYDGKNLNNAKEDAAEAAYKWLTGGSLAATPATATTTMASSSSGSGSSYGRYQ